MYQRDHSPISDKMITSQVNDSRFMLAAAFLMTFGAVTALPAAQQHKPISLHPENPHYFLWRGEPTILITSGEHYGALLNLDFDYVRYFTELQSKGLNHTRVFSGTYREIPSSFGITDNPLAPQPNRYQAPWARSNEQGYYDGSNKFDLTRWDSGYFRRLKDLMRAAQQRGIVVELTLFCPMYNEQLWQACPMNAVNNVNGLGTCPRNEVFTLRHPDLLGMQLAFVKKVVRELRDFDNLYYEVCNEPYQRRTEMAWQHRIVEAIVETERAFPAQHLISLNIANGRQKVENPHTAVSIFNFHYCVPPDTVEMNYGLNKVIGENETGFRGREDVLYRTEGWDFLIAGGALYNNLDYSFTAKYPDGGFQNYTSPGGGSSPLRRQLGILKDFLYGFDFVRMRPDNAVIREVSDRLIAGALVDKGRAYAVYLHVPIPKKPKMEQQYLRSDIQANLVLDLPQGRYRAEWVNTKIGRVDKQDTFQHNGGNRRLASPGFANDIALRIHRY